MDSLLHLFWKTQISALRKCPPLYGVVAKYSLGAANSPGVWLKTLLQLIAGMPRAAFAHCRNKRENRVVLPRVTLFVTTRCTLRCDKCIVHIPDIRGRRNMLLDELTRDMESLLAGIDFIYAFILSGGEAFLHPDLDKIIRFCAESGKIGDISVQTNGTVIPGEGVLAALRETKTLVKISKYPSSLQPGVEKLKRVLKENGIRHTHASGTFWNDTGYDGARQEGSEKRRFNVCISQLCLPYLDGKLHRCGAAAVLAQTGQIPCPEDEYIDLRAASPAVFPAQWRALMQLPALTACSYCLGQTYKTPKIPVAAQRTARD